MALLTIGQVGSWYNSVAFWYVMIYLYFSLPYPYSTLCYPELPVLTNNYNGELKILPSENNEEARPFLTSFSSL